MLLPGTKAPIQTPAASPFTSLGDTRLEMRVHNWAQPAGDVTLFWNAGFKVLLRGTGELCVSDEMDALPDYGGLMCADVSGQPDVIMRAERDTTLRQLRLSVRTARNDWSTASYCGTKSNGTTQNLFPCPIATVNLRSWAGTGGLGDGIANARISWIKWFSTLAAAGSGPSAETTPADLGDWRFEGGLANSAASGVTLGPLQSQPLPDGAAAGAVLYMPSPVGPPVCIAGPRQTFRAGYPARLDGSGSYALDGGSALGYSWRQVSGPTTATWSGRATAQPTVSGLVFGSYVFELTVTDSSGASTACQVKHGAVASDDNNVVITDNAAVDTLLGPLIRFGANPWPWFDDRHRAEADMQIVDLDKYYGAYWDPASPAYGSSAAQSAWLYGPAPANYYDNVAAFYALYYRSGIDDYRDAARKLADRFWASPMVNSGTTCDVWTTGLNNCYPARSLSVLGLVLRALDGRSDMWTGLRTIFNTYRTYYLDSADPSWGMWDVREMGYHLAVVSYCAMFDPDATNRQNCKSSISNSFARIWTPGRAADGSFPSLYYKTSSWDTGSSVSLSNGSRTVTGVGTAWTASMFQCNNSAGKIYPCYVWFTNDPAKAPASNAAGDGAIYTATVVDATHLTLDRPYEGVTGTHGWALPDGNAGFVGYGSQPFIQGILGTAFNFAAKAIADTDPANSALAYSYNAGIANWLMSSGFWNATKGMYYGVGYMNCRPPISDTDPFCTGGNSVGEARVLDAESLRTVMTAYGHTADPALKAFGDTLYSAMFSKPGSGGPNPDGGYIDGLNDGNGWYMIGTPPAGKAPKYFGMFFGFGAGSGWPAYRVGGVPQAQTGATTVVEAPTTGGSRMRLFVVAPSGRVSEAQCSFSRCVAETDPRQGEYVVSTQERNQ